MQFSIAKLLLVTLFVNFVVAAAFAFPPTLGVATLTFVALFVVPPFVIVGVVNTRGLRQSFFLGAMVSGSAHYVLNVYFAVMIAMTVFENGVSTADFADDSLRYVNACGFLLGALGGLCGMAAHYFLTIGQPRKPTNNPNPLGWDDQDESGRPLIYPETQSAVPTKEPAMPR